MDKKDSTNALLEAYLENQLSPQEKNAFEASLPHNPALAEEVLQYRQAYFALKLLRYHDLRKELQTYSAEKQRAARKLLWVATSVAASLLILVVSVYGISFSRSNEAIFQRYFSPYPSVYGTLRGAEITTQSGFFRAMEAYSAKNYTYAAEVLGSIPRESVLYEDAQLYRANALIALKKYGEARDVLEKLDITTPQVSWYLGLVLLAIEESKEAQKVFEALRQNPEDDFYQKKADLVLSDLHSPLRHLPGMVYH